MLSEKEVTEDLEMLHKVSGRPFSKTNKPSLISMVESSLDVRIDDNRLFYEKKWSVFVVVIIIIFFF